MAAFIWKGTPQESKQIMPREEERGKQRQRGKAAKRLSWGKRARAMTAAERTQTIVN